jgi:hypothetical protein
MPNNNALEIMGLAAIQECRGKAPDFVIGDPAKPYLRRWFLREEGPSGGLYLHEILRDDDDRALHDHPWDCSIYIIKGAYREFRKDAPAGELFMHGNGGYRHMKAETAHRLVVVNGPVWTLCFLGPRRREWGFHCPQGWKHWKEFVAATNKGEIGPGCGNGA